MKLQLTRKSASFFAVAVLTLATAGPALAQADDDDSDANVKTVVALTITNTQALDFGTLVVNSTLTGDTTVTIDPLIDAGGSITSSAPTEVFPLSGHSEARFTVTGDPGEKVQVNITGSPVTLLRGAGAVAADQMNLTIAIGNVDVYDTTTELLGVGAGVGANQFLMSAGDATLEVGGVLTVRDDNNFGDFTGTFNIEVTYV